MPHYKWTSNVDKHSNWTDSIDLGDGNVLVRGGTTVEITEDRAKELRKAFGINLVASDEQKEPTDEQRVRQQAGALEVGVSPAQAEAAPSPEAQAPSVSENAGENDDTKSRQQRGSRN